MLIPRIARMWRALAADRRGNMLMIFAFSIIPFTFAAGMGIDYAGAMRLQTRVNTVTDAAALSAVTGPMMKEGIDDACQAARATFESQVVNVKGLTIDTDQLSGLKIAITDTLPIGVPVTIVCPAVGVPIGLPSFLPLSRTAVVTYTARSANNFAGILGKTSLGIGGTASAKTTLAPYIDIHLALDTSQSMGLAATDADALKLWNATKEKNGRGCQFGCHARDPGEKYSMEEIARMPDVNARMRVDVLRDATIDMIDTASGSQGTAQNYQFALYRIGKNKGRKGIGVDEYMKLTTQLADVRAKVTGLTLSENDGGIGFGDTDLPTTATFVLPYLKATSASVDDGTTQTKARKFFFMVTDGVTDIEGSNCVYGHCTAPIDPTSCDAYKAKGITVGIVYTTYLPTKADPTKPSSTALRDEYIKLVQPIAANIRPNLEKCATPGWFFEASDAATIHSAMQTLFRQATQTPTLIR
jgi:Flp pilus assembly protein TadG